MMGWLCELRGLRDAMRMKCRERERWGKGIGSLDRPRVFYGREHVPQAGEIAQGGIVKCQDLQVSFPNAAEQANLVYLVSSAYPRSVEVLVAEARKAGAVIVVNQNGVAYRAWYGGGWMRANRPLTRVLHAADYAFYQSRFCRETSDRYLGPRRGESEVLYNCVDTQRFVPRPEAGLRGAPVILASGSHVQFYRVESALRAFACARKKIPEARLILAGHLGWIADEDRAEAEARALCRDLGIEESVTIRRRYTQQEAVTLLQGAHVLLHTKYNDPCPRLVVEALSCGLPVVYSASGGVPELVGDDAGVGVPVPLDWENVHPADPETLAQGMIAVLNDYTRFAKAARERAVKRFDVRPWIRRHEEVFGALVEKRRGHG